MDDEAYVGFVDTHAEGVGGYHHSDLITLPRLLALILDGGIQTGMVEGGGDACLIEQVSKLLGAFPATGIDDGGAFQTVEDMDELLPFVCGLAHDVCKVLPLEGHAEHMGFR